VALVVGLPVLHEVPNLFDINASTWYLPQPGVGWLTSSTRLTLVTGLLEELATQTSTQFPDLAGLFTLVGLERALSLADTLLGLGLTGLGLLADLSLRSFGGNGALAGRFPAWWRGR
jgi:hypothetical protein